MNQSQPNEKNSFEFKNAKKQKNMRAYKSPRLINYGYVATLTQGPTKNGNDGGGSMSALV